MTRNSLKYQIGQAVRVAPVISKEEWDNKYRGHIIWNHGGTKTEQFFGKTVTIEDHTDHCGGLCYRVRKEDGETAWIFEDSLLPPSRKDLVLSLLNGNIDVPTFEQSVKVVETHG